ncbi:uncharacterized protein DSM5745_10570 [Aspergillus mulundensis]|uniref:Guanine nucleotide-exchange factor SEC12 n=1 Tax=Aspergillus mulundensis TaxID=1810919 RepID=A0A3D8QJK7_9EURO|nr:hypothetical protein DSM5745_10570 [Aspergillus mulundensis]RDW61898.1 hypothetical protein DSM5745_10570 [Aspergillus mulundensis]
MAPKIPSAKITLSCPLFAADFDPRNHAFLLVAGGGGEGRSGVGNKIFLLNAFKRHELSEVVDVELSRDEDSVTSLAAAQSTDTSIVTFVGINSSLALQKQNQNRHLRSFHIDYPPRRADSASSGSKPSKPGQTVNLSQESVFRTVAGPKGSTDVYQRITRLSPWNGEGATRVAAITTGLAPSGEIVFLNANTTTPEEGDVIARIRLKSDEEAEDIDIAGQDEDTGLFTAAYTNGFDVFTCRISPDLRSNAAPDVRCVYSPENTKGKGPRPKFRALRFLSPTTLLLLQNAPDRKGCELILLDLQPTISSPASQAIIRQRKLRKSIKIGLGLDVCNLRSESQDQQQSIIAVSGSDQSLEVLTVDFNASRQHQTGAGYGPLRIYKTLHDVHPFSMTKICFSNFIPPLSPVTPETPPQYVKLASVSMGNTVVVHTFPLSPTPPSSRNPRYVLVRPGGSDFLMDLSGTLASVFSIVLVVLLLQAFTEIRGVMPPYLGITDYLPPDLRTKLAVPYNAPLTPPSPSSPIVQTEILPSPSAAPEESQSRLLRDIIPNSDTSLLISCNPSNNDLVIEPHTPKLDSELPEADSEAESGPDLDSNSASHPARQWTDLSNEDRMSWKTHLINAGLWDQQHDEDESILSSVFFRELCPHPQPQPNPDEESDTGVDEKDK